MPAQPSRITTVEARRLVRLAKATARQGANRAPSGAPEKLLERHKAKQPSAGGPQTSQGLRLLVVAHRVFGDRLGKYLELYGFGKTVLAAKLKDAKTIARTGTIKLADGTTADFADLTKRQVQDLARGDRLRQGPRKSEALTIGDTFTAPRDVVATVKFLRERLKSISPRHRSIPPRFSVKYPQDADPRVAKSQLRQDLKKLAAVLEVYRQFVDGLLQADLSSTEGTTFTETIGDRKVVLRGRPVRAARLQRALRRLPRSR